MSVVCSKRCLSSGFLIPKLRCVLSPPSSGVRKKHQSQGAVMLQNVDLAQIELEKIRNFSIIAHIDHGKSTLADRLLEYVGAIDPLRAGQPGGDRILDNLKVEKERGITVKAQTASVIYRSHIDGQDYLLNLIDTPGHVDFSSEVSRSLSACQGVILLVDANQGVQAQTVSNFYLAFANNLTVIPVLNKIDLPGANPEEVKDQLFNLFEIESSEVLLASAKQGIGIGEIFEAIVSKIPPPNLGHSSRSSSASAATPLRFFLQDSWYDKYRGTVNLVQVVDGTLKVGDNITSLATQEQYQVRSLGVLSPSEISVKALYAGQVGIMTCNMKSMHDAIIGDTFHLKDQAVEAVMSVQRPKPMVFAGLYPIDQSNFPKMKSAIAKVCLNDYSVSVSIESSPALGTGFRVGFLGILHMEVFAQRLEDEFDALVITTPPSVPYKLKLKKTSTIGQALANRVDEQGFVTISNPNEWLTETNQVESYWEPMVKGQIILPHEYLSAVTTLSSGARGRQTMIEYIDQSRVRLEVTFPLAEILTNFFDSLKAATSGYGSFDYEEYGYEEAPLVKVDILINDTKVPELATIAHASRAREHGKKLVARLEENIPRQQFAIKVQASVRSKILARGDIKPVRKDVTAKCYGGDLTRKMKLLRHQAEGKKRMKMVGKIQLTQDVFKKLLS